MKCINGRFYTTEGLVEDEGRLKKQIYDELSILEDWIRHLDWMSNYFEVKTIKKSEFEKWLSATKGL